MLLVSGGVASVGEFYGYLFVSMNLSFAGASPKLSRLTSLYFPLESSKVYISPNWYDGIMLIFFAEMSDMLTAQYITRVPIDGW